MQVTPDIQLLIRIGDNLRRIQMKLAESSLGIYTTTANFWEIDKHLSTTTGRVLLVFSSADTFDGSHAEATP